MLFLRPGRGALLATYIFLFMPRLYYVLEQSWTEPLVLLLAVAVVWCAIHRPNWKFLAQGLMIASKQYMVFLFPLIFLLIPRGSPKRVWLRSSGWVVGSAFVGYGSSGILELSGFLLGCWSGTVVPGFQKSMLEFCFCVCRCVWSISIPVAPFYYSGRSPFLILAVWRALTGRFRFRPGVGVGTVLRVFSKQAFCNYYFLVVGLFCCALAALPTTDSLFLADQKTKG